VIWDRNSLGVRVVARVSEILDRLADYWPVTLRQIHYQLVAANTPDYANTKSKYKMLSGWLYEARTAGRIPWKAMTDRARPFTDLSGFTSPPAAAAAYLRGMVGNYRRDLMQTQPERIEIWTEKDALSAVLSHYSEPYSVSVQTCRGFTSGSQLNDVVSRVRKPLRILYFGDHDPSGLYMSARDLVPRLAEKHGLDVALDRIALNRGQVQEYGLDGDYQIPKPKDNRTPWYIENYGNECWELDALPPNVLGDLVTTAIEGAIDMDLFETERAQESGDLESITDWATGWAAEIGATL
jgi:hypothetical protein